MNTDAVTQQKNWNGKPYHSLDHMLRERFGEKVYKVTLNGGIQQTRQIIFRIQRSATLFINVKNLLSILKKRPICTAPLFSGTDTPVILCVSASVLQYNENPAKKQSKPKRLFSYVLLCAAFCSGFYGRIS